MKIPSLLSLIAIPFIYSFAFAEPIKIGLAVPLSGFAANYGQAVNNGAQLFMEQHPELQDKIQLVVEDHAYDGKQVLSAIKKLRDIDRVKLIFVWGVTPGEVASPVAESMQVPVIVTTANAIPPTSKLLVNLKLNTEKFTEMTIDVVKRKGWKRTAFVGINAGSIIEVQKSLLKNGLDFAHEEIVPMEQSDFKALVSKLKSKKVDSIVLLLAPEQMRNLARQSKEQKFSAAILSGDVLAGDEDRAIVNKQLGAVTYLYGGSSDNFKADYRQKFNTTGNIFEAATGHTVM